MRVHDFTFFENCISNVSARVLGQEMITHSRGKLKGEGVIGLGRVP